MSDRKLFGLFSGAQVTLMVCAAIITPGAVYAVTYTSVVVTDPVSGNQGAVDAGRRQYVYDPIAGYANNPINLVNISGSAAAGVITNIYTVPAGKALILKSANMSYYNGAAGADNYAYFYGGGAYIAGYDDTNIADSHFVNFGSGVYIKSGVTLTSYTTSSTLFSFQGYLVPATAVPAAGTAAAAEQMVQVGGRPGK